MPLSLCRLLPARSQAWFARLASKRVSIMKTPPESQEKGLGAPPGWRSKQAERHLCTHATFPIPYKTCFFPKKGPKMAPVKKRLSQKRCSRFWAFLGTFFWPISGIQKSRETQECRKEGEGVKIQKFHVFSFLQKTHVSQILIDIE